MVRSLDKDGPIQTGSASFTAPARWRITERPGVVLLEAPERDLRAAVVQVDAADGDAAATAAWHAAGMPMKRAVRLAQTSPGRRGWDETREVAYDTSPNEKRVVSATAFRRGKAWTVILTDGSDSTSQRREAALLGILTSLRPAGHERESFAGKVPRRLDAARLAAITEFVEEAQRQAGVPGMAISLVQGGEVVLEKGFGVRQLGRPALVDPDTLFLIASNTKPLTTLLIATLVDEGKLGWDTPVTSVYPDFRLGDADTTRRVLMRHLICACTGLPSHDLEWLFEYGKATPASMLELLASIQPTTGFGETYQYSNNLAAAAGFVAGHAALPGRELGAAYDAAMQQRIFGRLGMRTTTFDMKRAVRGNHAEPHADHIDGATVLADNEPNASIVPMRPTGGAWSSARELIRYIQLELARGVLPGGKRLVSEASLLERRVKQVAIADNMFYGMGLVVDSEWGVPVILHGGGMIGFRSQMFFLPDHGVGGVILANADSGGVLLRPFIRRVIELLFDGRPEAAADVAASLAERRERFARDRASLTLPPDPAAARALASRYDHDALGSIAVTRGRRGVRFDFGEWSSAVATRKNADGTVSFVTTDPGVTYIDFVVAARDGKRALITRDGQHEYVFLEAGPAR